MTDTDHGDFASLDHLIYASHGWEVQAKAELLLIQQFLFS
jgi:hypothetical protein